MYAHSTTTSAPSSSENGCVQLDHTPPAALPTGTVPSTSAPIIVPSANGVSSDESENTVSISACSPGPELAVRSA